MGQKITYLPSESLADLAGLEEYIAAVREGYREQGRGGKTDPRTKLFHPTHDGMLMYYGALLPETGVMGVFAYVDEFKDASTWFLTFLADTETGLPFCLVDSPSVNPYKTGATGAVGVDALANDDASTVGLVGSGVQAKSQLLATATVRSLTDVKVYSPTPAHRQEFAREMDSRLDADVDAVASSAEVAAGVDILITATRATEPVIDADSIDPGTHITAMGQSHPRRRELDSETIARSVYVPDHRERAELASGELLGARRDGSVGGDHVHAELGDVVSGSAPGRSNEADLTVFDSGGTGIETVAATYMIYERAVEAGLGVKLPMTAGEDTAFEL